MGRADQGQLKGGSRHQVIPRTLCFVTHGTEVLLLRGGPHKRLWAGRYNGVGGHVEQGEDVHTAMRREITEETGLAVHEVRLRGIVHVDTDDPAMGVLIFVFTAGAHSRQTAASGEGSLEWWPMTDLPPTNLVEDLPHLLPKVLAMGPTDPPFFARYSYDADDRLVITFAASEPNGESSESEVEE